MTRLARGSGYSPRRNREDRYRPSQPRIAGSAGNGAAKLRNIDPFLVPCANRVATGRIVRVVRVVGERPGDWVGSTLWALLPGTWSAGPPAEPSAMFGWLP